MRGLLILLLLGGCATIHDPQPSDTKFTETERDWASVFIHEIGVAIENEDYGAYYFFMQELVKEQYRRDNPGKELHSSPILEFE